MFTWKAALISAAIGAGAAFLLAWLVAASGWLDIRF